MKNHTLWRISGLLLLIGMIALGGCSSPLDDAGAASGGDALGRVQLLIDGASGARTLAPASLTQANVTYKVSWSGSVVTEGPAVNGAVTFPMAPSSSGYTFAVEAVTDKGTIATGSTLSPIVVTADKTASGTVELVPVNKGEKGFFAYAVDFSAIHDVARGYLSLTPKTVTGITSTNTANDSTTGSSGTGIGNTGVGNTGLGASIHLVLEPENVTASGVKGAYDGTIELPPGIYDLTVRVSVIKDGAGLQDPYEIKDGSVSTSTDPTDSDSHTQNPTLGTSTINADGTAENVDLYKTEVVYIYSGETTSMEAGKYTFTDEDLIKLYFEGTLNLDQYDAVEKYTLTKVEVYTEEFYGSGTYRPRLLNVYTANNATQTYPAISKDNTATAGNITGPTTALSYPTYNWELYVPFYELNKNVTLSNHTLRFVFEFSSTSSTKKLYSWKTTRVLEKHGRFNVDLSETIRKVSYTINGTAATYTTNGGVSTGIGTNTTYGSIAALSHGYDNRNGYGAEFLLDENRDVIVGQHIWAKISQKDEEKPYHNIQSNNNAAGYDYRWTALEAIYKWESPNLVPYLIVALPKVVPYNNSGTRTSASTEDPDYLYGTYTLSANFLDAGATIPIETNQGNNQYSGRTAVVTNFNRTVTADFFGSGYYSLLQAKDELRDPDNAYSYYMSIDVARSKADPFNYPYWRLPTLEELWDINLNLKPEYGFETGSGYQSYYWSSTEAYVKAAATDPMGGSPVTLYKVFSSTAPKVTLPTDTLPTYPFTRYPYVLSADDNKAYGWSESTNRLRLISDRINYSYSYTPTYVY